MVNITTENAIQCSKFIKCMQHEFVLSKIHLYLSLMHNYSYCLCMKLLKCS